MCCVSDNYQYDTIRGDFNSITMASVNGERLNSKNLVEVKCSTLDKIISTHNDFLFYAIENNVNCK